MKKLEPGRARSRRYGRWSCAAIAALLTSSCAGLVAPQEPLPPQCKAEEGSLDAVGAPRRRVEAKYPRSALRSGKDGYVCLNFTVQPDGSVADICISDAQPTRLFEWESVAALQQWQYAKSNAPFRSGTCFMFNAE